jgi:hypothetical protein
MEVLPNAVQDTETNTDSKKEFNKTKTENNSNHSFKYYNLNNIQDIIGLFEKNNDKKYYSLKKYDVNRIIKILKKQHEDKIIIDADNIKMKNKLEKSKKIGKAFSDRFNLFNTLWTNLKKSFEIGTLPYPNGGLCGSFLRQFFELPYALENEFSEVGYGNPIGHDLDIVIFADIDPQYKKELFECFYKTMKKYQDHINFSLVNPELIKPIEISEKILVQVSDATIYQKDIKESDPIGKKNLIDIPHYIFKFKDKIDNSIIEIDVVACKPTNLAEWTNIDFNVNGIMLNDYGFHCDYNTPFTKLINCIRNKEAYCYIDFLELSSKAEQLGLLRCEKVPYLMQIAWTMRNRFKLLNVGYKNITGHNLVDYSINTTEDCPITSCKAPYYDITLNCKHKLSLMAFIGILEESNYESSQAIKCPLCRDDLKVNCISKECSEVEIFELKTLNDILAEKLTNCKPEEKEEIKFLSEDSDEFIKTLIQKKASENYNLTNSNLTVDTNIPPNWNIGRGRTGWDNS